MYNIERLLHYLHVLTRHCSCLLLPGRASPKHKYKGLTLWPPWDVIDGVITTKNIFFGIIWDDLFISEVKVKLRFLPQFFSKWPLFWVAAKHFYRCNTASWINQQNSHEHLRYFKFLIDALAEILMEIKQFQIWPTLWPAESSMTSWIRIYSNLVIILWYLCTGSLMAISLFVLSYREKCFYFVYKGT